MKKLFAYAAALIFVMGLLFYLIVVREPLVYKTVEFPVDVKINNFTEYPRADTILGAILHHVMEIDSIEVNIYNMPPNMKLDNYDVLAAVFYNPIFDIHYVYLKEKSLRSESTLRRVLSHEAIHIQQYNSGRLRIIGKGVVSFNDDTIIARDVQYEDREYEREAFDHQHLISRKVKEVLYE